MIERKVQKEKKREKEKEKTSRERERVVQPMERVSLRTYIYPNRLALRPREWMKLRRVGRNKNWSSAEIVIPLSAVGKGDRVLSR